MRVVEVGQYFVTKDTGDFRQFQISGLSRIHPSTRRPSFSTKRVDPRKISELDLYWKSRPVFSTSNMELKFELSP